MKRCVIITAYCLGKISDIIKISEDDHIVCADGGYGLALAENIKPDVFIGDGDSNKSEVHAEKILFVAAEKDETDTFLCLKYGISEGYKDFVIVGGISGRFDHSYANIQLLSYGLDKNVSVQIKDKYNTLFMIENQSITIKRTDAMLSLFSYTEECKGVCITGVKYKLDNAVIKNNFPIGVSNEFAEDEATISCTEGKLLIVLSKDN